MGFAELGSRGAILPGSIWMLSAPACVRVIATGSDAALEVPRLQPGTMSPWAGRLSSRSLCI